jgi:hypothetical protein
VESRRRRLCAAPPPRAQLLTCSRARGSRAALEGARRRRRRQGRAGCRFVARMIGCRAGQRLALALSGTCVPGVAMVDAIVAGAETGVAHGTRACCRRRMHVG